MPAAGWLSNLQVYESRALVLHTLFAFAHHLGLRNELDKAGLQLCAVYLGLLAVHAVIWSVLVSKPAAYARWRNHVTAVARVATLLCVNQALPYWTIPSGSCIADGYRTALLGSGVVASLFNTLFLPLPGWWQLSVHTLTTTIIMRTHNSRVCHELLQQKHDQACHDVLGSWPVVEVTGQTLAGLVGLIIDPRQLEALQAQQQCQVAVAFLQLCAGWLLPCVLQCVIGLDATWTPFLDELPHLNKACALAAMSLQLMGVLWFISFTYFSGQ